MEQQNLKFSFCVLFVFLLPAVGLAYYDLNLDLDFSTQDELDYYYETGMIDRSTYEQYLNSFEYLEEDKETAAADKSKAWKINIGTELDDYEEKTDDVSSNLKIEYQAKNFEIGILGLNKNEIIRNFS